MHSQILHKYYYQKTITFHIPIADLVLLSCAFLDFTRTVRSQKRTQFVYLLQKLRAFVGVGDIRAAVEFFDQMYLWRMLAFSCDKRLVFCEVQAM